MTCTVYFRDGSGKPVAGCVTAAETVFAAARNALAWFSDPHWLGPRPDDETVLEVQAVSRQKIWYVRVGSVKRIAI